MARFIATSLSVSGLYYYIFHHFSDLW